MQPAYRRPSKPRLKRTRREMLAEWSSTTNWVGSGSWQRREKTKEQSSSEEVER